MTKAEYWAAHCKRNPRFNDEQATIQMTVAMLHKLMDEAYDRGNEQSHKTTASMKKLFDDLGRFTK